MNKVITINLNGHACQLEEEAYERLRAYLESAARQLAGNPDRAEILHDIEQSIADKCRAALGSFRTVVLLPAIEAILAEMGPVVDGTGSAPGGEATAAAGRESAAGAGPGPASAPAGSAGTPVRRLYRVQEGAMLGGVCNGLAAFLGLPVVIIRMLFAGLILLWGLGLFVYLAMLVLVPLARTPDGQVPVFDSPHTAADFIRRAREGYYEGMKHWPDKQARRAWKQRFKDEMRAWRNQVRAEIRPGPGVWSWPVPPPGRFGLWPVFALIRGVLKLAFVAVVLSLVCTGALFGVALPGGLPLWLGLVLAALLYQAVVWPFRWRRGWCGPACAGGGFGWILLLLLFVWYGQRHHPGSLPGFLRDLPAFSRQVADSLRDWWQGR